MPRTTTSAAHSRPSRRHPGLSTGGLAISVPEGSRNRELGETPHSRCRNGERGYSLTLLSTLVHKFGHIFLPRTSQERGSSWPFPIAISPPRHEDTKKCKAFFPSCLGVLVVKKVQIMEGEFPLENTLVYLGKGVLSQSTLSPVPYDQKVASRRIR
jgi:hypothetical protein